MISVPVDPVSELLLVLGHVSKGPAQEIEGCALHMLHISTGAA